MSVQVSGCVAVKCSHWVRLKLQTQSRISREAVQLSVYVPRVLIQDMVAPKRAGMTKNTKTQALTFGRLVIQSLYYKVLVSEL